MQFFEIFKPIIIWAQQCVYGNCPLSPNNGFENFKKLHLFVFGPFWVNLCDLFPENRLLTYLHFMNRNDHYSCIQFHKNSLWVPPISVLSPYLEKYSIKKMFTAMFVQLFPVVRSKFVDKSDQILPK